MADENTTTTDGQEDGGTPAPDGQNGAAGDGGTPEPLTYATWYEAQDEAVRSMLSVREGGLKTALENEREQRKTLAKQLKSLSDQAEDGSALRQQLEQMQASVESATQRAAFYESAPGDVANLKLAHLAAMDAGLIDPDGGVSWDAVRERFPELFRQARTVPPGNAGNGAAPTGSPQRDMNDYLRAAAGIR